MKKMVYWIFIGAALLCGMAIGQHRNRFEYVYDQAVPAGESLKDFRFIVFHDRDTGQEIVCTVAGGVGGPSCWPSGRKW